MGTTYNTKITVWELPDTCTIIDCKNLHSESVKFLKKQTDLTMDLSRISNIDITGIQIILSAIKTINQQGYTFQIQGEIPVPVQNLLYEIGIIESKEIDCERFSQILEEAIQEKLL